MREVKEKQHMKAPKTHDPTRRMPRRAQKAYGKVNEIIPAGEEPYQSPDDYAVQKTEEYTQETADRAYHGAKKTVQKTKDEVRDIHDRIQEHRQERHEQAEPYQEEGTQRPGPSMREQENVIRPNEHTASPQEQPISEAHVPTAQRQHEILEHQRAAQDPISVPESATAQPEGVTSIDQAYQSRIDKAASKLEREIDHDEFEIVYRGDNNDGDSVAVYNWNDVLAVYAVLYTTGDNQVVMIEPSDETERRLSEVFNVMNRVTLTYEIKEEVPEDAPKPNPVHLLTKTPENVVFSGVWRPRRDSNARRPA